jgi:hypothetical protein
MKAEKKCEIEGMTFVVEVFHPTLEYGIVHKLDGKGDLKENFVFHSTIAYSEETAIDAIWNYILRSRGLTESEVEFTTEYRKKGFTIKHSA